VTICVAAMCNGGSTLFGASDRMLSGRDVEFEPPQTKVFSLTTSISVLTAGDTALQVEILNRVRIDVETRVKAEPDNWWLVEDVAALYSRYYSEARLKSTERAILAPLGLTSTSFLQMQQQLSPQLVTQLATELINYDAPFVQAIVLGIDHTGGHIYVCNGADVTCQDGIGFAAIGSGAAHANSVFMFGGHTKWKPIPETFLMTYFAKKRAEVAPGVGTATDMLTIGPELGSYTAIGPEPMAKCLEIWNRAQTKRLELEREAEEEINHYVQGIIDAATAKEQAALPQDSGGTKAPDEENVTLSGRNENISPKEIP